MYFARRCKDRTPSSYREAFATWYWLHISPIDSLGVLIGIGLMVAILGALVAAVAIVLALL